MFQYYDSNDRKFIDFDDTLNEFLEKTKDLMPCRIIGDTIYIFDLSSMKQFDILNNLSRKIRKV